MLPEKRAEEILLSKWQRGRFLLSWLIELWVLPPTLLVLFSLREEGVRAPNVKVSSGQPGDLYLRIFWGDIG